MAASYFALFALQKQLFPNYRNSITECNFASESKFVGRSDNSHFYYILKMLGKFSGTRIRPQFTFGVDFVHEGTKSNSCRFFYTKLGSKACVICRMTTSYLIRYGVFALQKLLIMFYFLLNKRRKFLT